MSSPIGFGLPPSGGQPALVFEPSVGQVPTNDPAGQPLALTAAQVQAVQRRPEFSGELPQRVFLLGDSLTMREFRYFSGTPVLLNATDVEIPLGSGAALPPPGSFARVINQTDAALNIDVPVVGSGTNSMIVRFPFSITGRTSSSMSGAIYGISNDSGWWNYAESGLAVLGKPVAVIRSAGNGGDTLRDMRLRIATEIAPQAQAGDIVAVMGGVNGAFDVGAIDASTAAELVAEFGSILDELLALGVTVCVSTVTQAQASGYWTTAATALANTAALNGYLRGRALSEARVHVFDSHAALGGGDYAASDVESVGIHLLPSGAAKVGARFVTDCGNLFGKRTFRRVLSATDSYVDANSWNLLTNPELAGASGSTPPTNWTAAGGGGTKTYTSAARADGIGNDLTVAHSHTAATGTTMTQVITDRIAAGQRLIFGIEYESDALAEGHYWNFNLEFDVGGVTYSYRLQNNQFSYAQGGRLPPAGNRHLFEHYGSRNAGGREGVLVPGNFTAARVVLRWQLGASGSMSFKVSRPHVYRVG